MMDLKYLEAMSKIRRRSPDRLRAKSLLEAAESTMKGLGAVRLTEGTGTIIFRETYESLRQLGDARWWLLGYEPRDHEVSMEVLMAEKIPHSARLAKLDRYREIRNNANYKGYVISGAVAQEILDFWKECGIEIMEKLRKEMLQQ